MKFNVKAIVHFGDPPCKKSIVVYGIKDVPHKSLSVQEIFNITDVEAFLEKLTGLRWHIEEVDD